MARKLPFTLHAYRDGLKGDLHFALVKGQVDLVDRSAAGKPLRLEARTIDLTLSDFSKTTALGSTTGFRSPNARITTKSLHHNRSWWVRLLVPLAGL